MSSSALLRRVPFAPILLASAALLINSCSNSSAPESGPVTLSRLQGRVHGGQQPVAGANLQIFAAGSTGYGTGATSLLNTPVLTDSGGNFSVTGDYTCPSANSQIYLVATGGNPGLAPGASNPALAMLAVLGPCSLLTPSTFINLDEVTTVASVYALAGFMDPTTTQIGASSTNAIGLSNAFATVNNLANTATGQALALTPAGNGTVPQAEINSLADILASCINSDGTGAACTTLFAATTPTGGTAPTNTLQATLSIAQHPANNVTALYNQAAAFAPFQPTLPAVPNDWTVVINHPVGQDIDFYSIAIDSLGNVWMGADHSVTELANDGTILSGPAGYTGGGLNGTRGMAIDLSGNAWVVNFFGNSITKLSSNGSILSGPSGFPGEAGDPLVMNFTFIAIDGFNNAWALHVLGAQPYSVVKLANDGTPLSGAHGFSPCSSGSVCGLHQPESLAIDSSEDIWIVGEFPAAVGKIANDGTPLSGPGGFTDEFTYPIAIAIDGSGSAWVTNTFGSDTISNTVTKLSSTGTKLALFTQGGMVNPTAIAIDGSGGAWIKSASFGRVTHLDNSGTALSGQLGLVNGTLVPPFANCIPVPDNDYCERSPGASGGIAVDNSGNVWVNNLPGYASELVGAATPVTTPLSVGVRDNKLGARP